MASIHDPEVNGEGWFILVDGKLTPVDAVELKRNIRVHTMDPKFLAKLNAMLSNTVYVHDLEIHWPEESTPIANELSEPS